MADKNILGKAGELFARKYFESLGFELTAENYRFERAETDLIFKDDTKKLLVFVEVKTRRNKKFGEPEESITEKKVQQLIKSAQGFVMMNPRYEEYEKRFDVASVMITNGKEELKHLENVI